MSAVVKWLGFGAGSVEHLFLETENPKGGQRSFCGLVRRPVNPEPGFRQCSLCERYARKLQGSK